MERKTESFDSFFFAVWRYETEIFAVGSAYMVLFLGMQLQFFQRAVQAYQTHKKLKSFYGAVYRVISKFLNLEKREQNALPSGLLSELARKKQRANGFPCSTRKGFFP